MEWITPVLSGEFIYFCSYSKYQLYFPTPLTLHFSFPCNTKIYCCLYVTLFLINLLAGTDKNDSADKVAEKLEELSVKEESKESEKKETKEKNEEKQ